jgi:hypothetical protein
MKKGRKREREDETRKAFAMISKVFHTFSTPYENIDQYRIRKLESEK